MIDTHSHIYVNDFSEDLTEVLDRASDVGVTHIFMPAIDLDSLDQMKRVSHPAIDFYKMAGLHPCDVEKITNEFEQRLFDLADKDDIYGIGETGLDYYWSTDLVKEQKMSLQAHCRIAKAVKKPIILHNRESTEDLLQVIEEEQDGSLTGIWHCFNGSVDEGKRAIDLGLNLGIGGVVTFKNGGVDKTVKHLPLNRMVLETDAPYLAPTPKRGKRNEPSFIQFTAQKLADIFELPLNEVVDKTNENAKRIFNIQ
ncbi:MAG TPA: TatD family deoxyribonuclease [Balneolaceae bacterium]|nr:TatD family deoxyribonuclease [Balneolaceae bacterium]|tara:strand:- start:263488 stop:264249 length:762 start_codon:yes stop_codon:yes gene_type:complete